MSLKISVRSIERRKLYKVKEAAKDLRVCSATIRRMVKAGLPVVIKNSNPLYIKGEDLMAFVKKKNSKFSVKIKSDEFFCFPCRRGVRSVPEEFQIILTRKKWGKNFHQAKLVGKCSVCGHTICKFTTEEQIISLVKKGVFDRKHISVLIESDNSKE
jgi:hypothetical protein